MIILSDLWIVGSVVTNHNGLCGLNVQKLDIGHFGSPSQSTTEKAPHRVPRRTLRAEQMTTLFLHQIIKIRLNHAAHVIRSADLCD